MKNKNKKGKDRPAKSKNFKDRVQIHKKKQKKIKKDRQKVSKKIINKDMSNQSVINQFIIQNPIYFAKSKPEILQQWGKFPTIFDMKEVLAMSEKKVIQKVRSEMAKKQCQNYMKTLKIYHTYSYQNIKLTHNKTKSFLISYIRDKLFDPQKDSFSRSMKFLSKTEDYIFRNKETLQNQIIDFIHKASTDLKYQKITTPQDILELIFLCKITKRVEKEFLKAIQDINDTEDMLYQIKPFEAQSQTKHQTKLTKKAKPYSSIKSKPKVKLQNQFIKFLIIKNVRKSLNEEADIDFYNYHKAIQACQDNNYYHKQFIPFQTQHEFRVYIKNRIPKKSKASIYNLKTPCSACFSSFSQVENPIIKCNECTLRMHIYCQSQKARCERCKYYRTSNLEKMLIQYCCYICRRQIQKGILVHGVSHSSPHYYAHNFCLYLHQQWSVSSHALVGYFSQESQLQKEECTICHKNKGLLFSCLNCNTKFHGLCAYLHGFDLKMQADPNNSSHGYKIVINCCKSLQFKERRSIQRRFKLNHQKIVFQKSRQLMSYIYRKQQIEPRMNVLQSQMVEDDEANIQKFIEERILELQLDDDGEMKQQDVQENEQYNQQYHEAYHEQNLEQSHEQHPIQQSERSQSNSQDIQ